MQRRLGRCLVLALAATTALSLLAAPAAAGRKPKAKAHKPRVAVTKMLFKLDAHELQSGDTATGSVRLLSRSGNRWLPLADAPLTVWVSDEQVGAATTDADGRATVSHPTSELGEFAMKVRYAGDATHKRAQRAQGFEVLGTFYADADADGYGDPATTTNASAQPDGYVTDGGDCDDADPGVNPGATETLDDGIDQDCDGADAVTPPAEPTE